MNKKYENCNFQNRILYEFFFFSGVNIISNLIGNLALEK